MNRFGQLSLILVFLAMFIGVGLNISMFWAIDQSRGRMECYQAGRTVEACGEPNAYERFLAKHVAGGAQ